MLNSLLHGAGLAAGVNGRRKMSAQTRAKLAAAARERWARKRAATNNARGRRSRKGITPSGRRKLSQMMKARWAKRRAAAKR